MAISGEQFRTFLDGFGLLMVQKVRKTNKTDTTVPPPPNTVDLGTAVFGNQRYWETYITYKTLIWDLEMGGGIGGEAVLGEAVLGGGRLYCPFWMNGVGLRTSEKS